MSPLESYASGAPWIPDRRFWQSELGRAFLEYETKLGIATGLPQNSREAAVAWQICHDERHKFLQMVARCNSIIIELEGALRAARDAAEINRQAWKNEEQYADSLEREIADLKSGR